MFKSHFDFQIILRLVATFSFSLLLLNNSCAQPEQKQLLNNPNIEIIAPIEYVDFKVKNDTIIWLIKEDGTSHAIGPSGKLLVPPDKYEFDFGVGYAFVNGLAVTKTANNGHEIMRLDGRRIPILQRYDEVKPFNKGYAVVGHQQRYGLIDSTGKEIIAPIYDDVMPQKLGFSIVRQGFPNKGVINSQGEIVIPIDRHIIYQLEPGYVFFVMNLDTNAKYIWSNLSDNGTFGPTDISIFGDGNFGGGYFKVQKGDKYGLLDSTLNIVVPFEYDNISLPDANHSIILVKNGKSGVISIGGRTIIPMEYDKILKAFNDSLGFLVTKSGKTGVCDNNGTLFVPLIYDQINQFEKKQAFYVVTIGNKSGLMNQKGEIVAPINFEGKLSYESSGLWGWFYLGRIGLISTNDTVLVPPIYEYITFPYDLPDYILGNLDNRSYHLIDKVTKKVMKVVDNAELERIRNPKQNTFGVYRDKKHGLENRKNEIILPTEYDYISSYSETAFLVKKAGKIGIVNQNGEFTLPLQAIQMDEKARFNQPTWFKVNGKYGLLDNQGRQILPPVFVEIRAENKNRFWIRINDRYGLIRVKP